MVWQSSFLASVLIWVVILENIGRFRIAKVNTY